MQDSKANFQTLQRDFATVSGKVSSVEEEIKAVEEQHREAVAQEAFVKEAVIQEAKEWAIDNFKWYEEYITSHDFDVGYNKGVEEIFFNLWRKIGEVNFSFLGKKLKKLMATWIAREKKGELNTRLPPSP